MTQEAILQDLGGVWGRGDAGFVVERQQRERTALRHDRNLNRLQMIRALLCAPSLDNALWVALGALRAAAVL